MVHIELETRSFDLVDLSFDLQQNRKDAETAEVAQRIGVAGRTIGNLKSAINNA